MWQKIFEMGKFAVYGVGLVLILALVFVATRVMGSKVKAQARTERTATRQLERTQRVNVRQDGRTDRQVSRDTRRIIRSLPKRQRASALAQMLS